MSDRQPGTSYSNPIWYKGYRIYLGPAYTPDSRWQYAHDECDGAPIYSGDGPADNRAGLCASIDDCKAEIDEIETEAEAAQ